MNAYTTRKSFIYDHFVIDSAHSDDSVYHANGAYHCATECH